MAKTLSLIAVLFFSAALWAKPKPSGVHVIGNGADVVSCSFQGGNSIHLLDTYETSLILNKYDQHKASFQTKEDFLHLYLERVKSLDPVFYEKLNPIVEAIFAACSTLHVDHPVPSINDEAITVINPVHCSIQQLAFQWPNSRSMLENGSCPFNTDFELYNRLSNSDKAAFYLHESIIHYLKSKRTPLGSLRPLSSTDYIRFFVGLVALGQPEYLYDFRDQSLESYFDLVYFQSF